MTISAQVSVSEAHTKVCLPEAPYLWSWLKVTGGDSHPGEEAGWGHDSLLEEAAQTSQEKQREGNQHTNRGAQGS